jgi:hypothetical protein
MFYVRLHEFNLKWSLPATLVLAVLATSCASPDQPVTPAAGPKPPVSLQSATSTAPSPGKPSTASLSQPAAAASTENVTGSFAGSAVRIIKVYFRGSLQALGCCDRGLYERDEFVAIQNTGNTPQDVAGWKLVNLTRGYPTFTFPLYFPCLPFTPSTETKYAANVQNYVANAPQTVEQMFSTPNSQAQPDDTETEINWASCSPIAPLDETPMRPPRGATQGQPLPCVLYSGQTVLVFTDEIHCQYGGLSFRYGQGNLWDNEIPDTAILYDSAGNEVSRRSYTTGK